MQPHKHVCIYIYINVKNKGVILYCEGPVTRRISSHDVNSGSFGVKRDKLEKPSCGLLLYVKNDVQLLLKQ